MNLSNSRGLLYFTLCFVEASAACAGQQGDAEAPGSDGATGAASSAAAPAAAGDQIEVLIIDGVNNHDW